MRCAEWTDCRALWLWANDVTTRENSLNSAPISWLQHVKWFEKTLQDPTQLLLVTEVLGVARAVARLQLQGESAEISLNVCPSSRGQGFGRHTLKQVLRLAFQDWPIRTLRARIKGQNAASQRLFSKAGFRLQPHTARGESERVYILGKGVWPL